MGPTAGGLDDGRAAATRTPRLALAANRSLTATVLRRPGHDGRAAGVQLRRADPVQRWITVGRGARRDGTAPKLPPPDIDAVPRRRPPTAAAPGCGTGPRPETKAAMDAFAAGRDSFKARQYARAQAEVEKAIGSPPPTRSCTSSAPDAFAQGKYQETAGTLYAVLARGPGWIGIRCGPCIRTWTLTPPVSGAGGFIREHPSDGAVGRFGYHYL